MHVGERKDERSALVVNREIIPSIIEIDPRATHWGIHKELVACARKEPQMFQQIRPELRLGEPGEDPVDVHIIIHIGKTAERLKLSNPALRTQRLQL